MNVIECTENSENDFITAFGLYKFNWHDFAKLRLSSETITHNNAIRRYFFI